MPDSLLSVRGLAVRYGAIAAVHGIDLDVAAGEIVALIGANGAGKTSTLAALSGLVAPAAGSVRLRGAEIASMDAHFLPARGLAHVPEGRRMFPRLSVDENLVMGAWTRTDEDGIRADRERIFALFPILRDRLTQAAGTLSGGEQQMLAIARALLSRPAVLLLDEPSLGVAPQLTELIFANLRALAQEGLGILLVEQDAHAALAMAHHAYVLENGRITLTGSGSELATDPRIRAAYLGGDPT